MVAVLLICNQMREIIGETGVDGISYIEMIFY